MTSAQHLSIHEVYTGKQYRRVTFHRATDGTRLVAYEHKNAVDYWYDGPGAAAWAKEHAAQATAGGLSVKPLKPRSTAWNAAVGIKIAKKK